MGLNVSTTAAFENKEFLRNAVMDILTQQSASQDTTAKIIDKTIFDIKDSYVNPQMSVIKASTQISLNASLSETLKYLRTHSKKKTEKKYVFGELWNIVSTNNEASEENPYKGELYDFEIDKNVKNIFAA